MKDKSDVEESSNHKGVEVDGVEVLRTVILVAYVAVKCDLQGSTEYVVRA